MQKTCESGINVNNYIVGMSFPRFAAQNTSFAAQFVKVLANAAKVVSLH